MIYNVYFKISIHKEISILYYIYSHYLDLFLDLYTYFYILILYVCASIFTFVTFVSFKINPLPPPKEKPKRNPLISPVFQFFKNTIFPTYIHISIQKVYWGIMSIFTFIISDLLINLYSILHLFLLLLFISIFLFIAWSIIYSIFLC